MYISYLTINKWETKLSPPKAKNIILQSTLSVL